MSIAASELVLKPDGSIYHLGIKPSQMCNTIILVGDPNRVAQVSKFFDSMEYTSENREIIIHKGVLKGKEIMCISTGMGTDNIDIVLNELDALVNIDFETRTVKSKHTSLQIVRFGTSGALREDIKVGSFVVGKHGIGLDSLIWFYDSKPVRNTEFEQALQSQINFPENVYPYVIEGSKRLLDLFEKNGYIVGNTATFNGFYGPQGRKLRIKLADENLNEQLGDFIFGTEVISNFEMETSGIYGLSSLLGHEALSVNLILANRVSGEFLEDYHDAMDQMIQKSIVLL